MSFVHICSRAFKASAFVAVILNSKRLKSPSQRFRRPGEAHRRANASLNVKSDSTTASGNLGSSSVRASASSAGSDESIVTVIAAEAAIGDNNSRTTTTTRVKEAGRDCGPRVVSRSKGAQLGTTSFRKAVLARCVLMATRLARARKPANRTNQSGIVKANSSCRAEEEVLHALQPTSFCRSTFYDVAEEAAAARKTTERLRFLDVAPPARSPPTTKAAGQPPHYPPSD